MNRAKRESAWGEVTTSWPEGSLKPRRRALRKASELVGKDSPHFTAANLGEKMGVSGRSLSSPLLALQRAGLLKYGDGRWRATKLFFKLAKPGGFGKKKSKKKKK